MKKFLICGLGSIGQRHVRMIKSVTKGEAEIAAYRARNLELVISDDLQASFGEKPEDYYGLETFGDLDAALAWKPDAVFVTNPISMHIPTAIEAAKIGAHIFIEKPLGCTDEGLKSLSKLVDAKSLVCMVGYQLRYHPGYRHLKKLLEAGVLGRLISADLHFGEWLPGMHPYEDYRDSHAARADQGGGVILCLSHKIDIAYWLFGLPKSLYAQGGHLSSLEMDVEDTADILMACQDGERTFPVHVHLDFLQSPARFYTHVVGDRGSILFDYRQNRLEINIQGAEQEVISYEGFQRNQMFYEEVSDFINSCQCKLGSPNSLVHGAAVLGICLAAKKSLRTGRIEEIL